ncbi:MAG TPA: ISKra4 family transposase, partial [Terriglobales bacterium]|nr:ISKra4 family transposase [Terriglobales bacterium]
MRYHEYLARGWPIARGPVEGACKNLIKDRMERFAVRWTEQLAEAIVQLRALSLRRFWPLLA